MTPSSALREHRRTGSLYDSIVGYQPGTVLDPAIVRALARVTGKMLRDPVDDVIFRSSEDSTGIIDTLQPIRVSSESVLGRPSLSTLNELRDQLVEVLQLLPESRGEVLHIPISQLGRVLDDAEVRIASRVPTAEERRLVSLRES